MEHIENLVFDYYEKKYDYDFDSMDLEILNREFIVIDGEEYSCCVKGSADGDYWYE